MRRETASVYLKAARLAVRPPGRWGHAPANPAKGVPTDLGLLPPGVTGPPTFDYSRKSVRLLTFTSSTRRWAELHEEAFRRLGGSQYPHGPAS